MSIVPHPDRSSGYDPPPALSLHAMELSRNLRADPVSRLQPTPPLAVDASRTVADAVAALRRRNVGCLLVTRAGKLVGIFTERDLLKRVLAPGQPLDTPLETVMTPDPVTVGPRDAVKVAVKRMEKGGYRHLPVVDAANRPVGILSARKVVAYLVEHFPGLVHNQPPALNKFPETAEGA
jgi:CBS domain-containing protein